MARSSTTLLFVALAIALCAPAGASARTPCPNEQLAPTATNGALVSDAIFCLTNQVRASFGLPSLHRDGRLDTAATQHSADMALNDYFAHQSPDGLMPGQRATAQGYLAGVGENIAAGYRTARDVVVAWMQSAGHCTNMLSAAIDIGVGTAVSSGPYYTQDFGDYFTQTIDEGPRDACPYTIDIDALPDAAPAAAVAAPASARTASVPAPAPPPQQATGPSKPALGALGLSPSRLRAGAGTTVSYSLSHATTVVLRIQRAPRCGRRSGACARWQTLPGRIVHSSSAGANAVRFSGRLRGRLLASAGDAAGTASATRRIAFSVVRR